MRLRGAPEPIVPKMINGIQPVYVTELDPYLFPFITISSDTGGLKSSLLSRK